jgi:hypothetical protein
MLKNFYLRVTFKFIFTVLVTFHKNHVHLAALYLILMTQTELDHRHIGSESFPKSPHKSKSDHKHSSIFLGGGPGLGQDPGLLSIVHNLSSQADRQTDGQTTVRFQESINLQFLQQLLPYIKNDGPDALISFRSSFQIHNNL